MNNSDDKKSKKAHVPFIVRLCFSLEQTEKHWCEFCGEQIKTGYKLSRNGKGGVVFVCDDCLKKAK